MGELFRLGAPMRRIGFTGTRKGMTPEQREVFRIRMIAFSLGGFISEWHDGSAIGSDAQARELVRELRRVHFRELKIHSHPPLDDRQMVHLDADVYYNPKKFLDRDHDIVDASDDLIACPRMMKEELRSGTWATIRYARKKGQFYHIMIIWPDGSTRFE